MRIYESLKRSSKIVVLGFLLAGCGSNGSSSGGQNPVPNISSVSPLSLTAGLAAQSITINGSGFISSSSATFNGSTRTASIVSSTQMTIQLSQADLSTPGTFPVTVSNPAPGGGVSNTATFSVTNATPVAVLVSVVASDGVNPLSYSWKATDGSIVDANSPSTTWTLPNGLGLHFAYVLVSNSLGGYTERRVVVSTDSIGNPSANTPPVTLLAPPSSAPAAFTTAEGYRNFVNAGVATGETQEVYIPDVQVRLQDSATGQFTQTITSDLKGQVYWPLVPFAALTPFCSLDGTNFLQCGPVPSFNASGAYTEYIDGKHFLQYSDSSFHLTGFVGSFLLPNGSPCGVVNQFFGRSVTANARLLNSSSQVLATSRVNAFGNYALPFDSTAVSVELDCENAPPTSVTIPTTNGALSLVIPPAVLAGGSAPTVTSMSATLNGSQVGKLLPPPSNLPSDVVPRSDAFFTFQGSDSRHSACLYYQAIGAVQQCDSSGNASGSISFDDWKRAVKIDAFATGGATVVTATYINKIDLNLARNHHSISYGPNQTAAYVCNHAGPTVLIPQQSEIDSVVDATVQGQNLVACVAMDYSITQGVNGNQPFTRFLIFGPSGVLLPSVNLDGRTEKFVPGVCVACHAGERYVGRFPEDGSGLPDVGAHFLPYDAGNFEFSTKAGLTESDQEGALFQLNQNVLNAAPTPAESALINGWYASGQVLDKSYLPPAWQTAQNTNDPFAAQLYHNVTAPYCRTCHTALVRWNWDVAYSSFAGRGPTSSGPGGLSGEIVSTMCGGNGDTQQNHSMPSSRVTFDQLWLSANAAAALLNYQLTLPCNQNVPDPAAP